jgi:hypothetical protein
MQQIWSTNQVPENQCIDLIEECFETVFFGYR